MMVAQKVNLDAARTCYDYLNWSFTPLAGKKPIRSGWQKEPRLPFEIIERHTGNIGLRTGTASGVIVVDVDVDGQYDLPATVEVKTGKGRHLYYQQPVDGQGQPVVLSGRIGKLYPGVDVRAEGNQVVFPGSIHPDTGSEYFFLDGRAPWQRDLAPLPDWIISACFLAGGKSAAVGATGARGSYTPRRRISEPYVRTALLLEARNVATAANGTRNDTLNRAAFSLGQFVGAGVVDRDLIEAELLDAAEAAGLPRAECLATIRSGLEAGTQQPRELPKKPAPRGARVVEVEVDPTAPTFVLIPGSYTDDSGQHVEVSTNSFANAVLDSMPEGTLYTRSGVPGEILGEPGHARWEEIKADRMRLLIDERTRLCVWKRPKKDDAAPFLAYIPCTRDAAGLVIAAATHHPKAPALETLVTYPVYGRDWRRAQPGMNEDGLYYDEPPALAGIVPETSVEEIQDTYLDLVTDFPFETESDRENFLGLLLTPIVAPALRGNRPLHLITASLERTGKSKLAETVLGGILLGERTPAMQITGTDEERDKRIIALLLTGKTLLCLDNLPSRLDSAVIASLLTAGTYQARQLQQSRILSLTNNLTIVATGNNTYASGEIAKRIVPITLQPRDSRPEERMNFQHPDLNAWVAQNRRRLIAILLGMVENWLSRGMPAPREAHPKGGFEEWARAIGGIMESSGFGRWRHNEAGWLSRANSDGEERSSFVATWWERYGGMEVSSGELLVMATENDLLGWILSTRGERAQQVKLGSWLRRHINTPIEQWIVRARRPDRSHTMYYLESTSR